MVLVAQLAEHLLVAQKVAGSSPVKHPKKQNRRKAGFVYKPVARVVCYKNDAAKRVFL